jgi:hypothetical protein
LADRTVTHWACSFNATGLQFTRVPMLKPTASDLQGYVSQLVDDGFAHTVSESTTLTWDSFYDAANRPEYESLGNACGLPLFTGSQLCLGSRRSLIDNNFSIVITGWRSHTGNQAQFDASGAILRRGRQSELMRAEQWRLYSAVVAFAQRPDEERSEHHNRAGWARIRSLAKQADAGLDDFLDRSVVLSPEQLKIELRKSQHVVDDNVIEVIPTFDEAPQDWLAVFDASPILDRYDITTPQGIVQVLVSPAVRGVLGEIKAFPARRVAGSRAQAFIVNPYAALGESASTVIDEAHFESARDAAGLHYERFTPTIESDGDGRPRRIGLLVETANSSGPVSSEVHWLTDDEVEKFVQKAQSSATRGFQLIAWKGFDLEIQGDLEVHLNALTSALDLKKEPHILITRDQIYDLSAYSNRVSGIGVEEAYYSPYIAKLREDEGWFPDNVEQRLLYQPSAGGDPIPIPISQDKLEQLVTDSRLAESRGESTVSAPWLPEPIAISEVTQITDLLGTALHEVAQGTTDPLPRESAATRISVARKSPVVRPNITALDYLEERSEALRPPPVEPQLPKSLRSDVELKQHQLDGIAWLEHLFANREAQNVRGAVLADDMGLGKTLQLLCMAMRLLEDDPALGPMLVVAPVALLENWLDELKKFFTTDATNVLIAYGDALSKLRVATSAIDSKLRDDDGLRSFLRPGWIGTSRIVLTTYETLRDLEFSFARERWSVMVCDEAQRIKNPAALVTRAAKKQNVQFRIACTGTPVENTLADLWCLFDFVQPGLLGALSDFGKTYRRPIEAKTEEERARVEQLRTRIAPQILRRTKAEVARDLPAKIVDDNCKRLPFSPTQRHLYASAIQGFRGQGDGDAGSFKNHLGLLHYLRRVCTDPRPRELTVFVPEPVDAYKAKSPKLAWLLGQLATIRAKGDKAIIFCEFREIQRLLQHYISASMGYECDIINGDTAAESSSAHSRQKRLKAFQAKPGFGAIILSPLAVGFGLNIQAANHVIHFTRTWNPAKEDQATDRAYRIGQTKDVFVYYPTVVADDFATFDVVLDTLLSRKRDLAQDMLNGSADISARDFRLDGVQLQADEAAATEEPLTVETALQLDWRLFEGLVAALWSRMGFTCYVTPRAFDSGVDVVALRGDAGVLLQAKTARGSERSLSWDGVKEVVAGAAVYERRHPGVRFDRVCISNHYFGDQAKTTASANNVQLIDRDGLARLLEEHLLSLHDIREAISPSQVDVLH